MKSNCKPVEKEHILRQKQDRMRSLRVVKYLEYPFILPDSPIDMEEGYIVSDRDTYDIFASFIFKNITDRQLKKLDVRINCYLNQNIPYAHIDFEYSHDLLTFGIIGKDDVDLKFKDSNKKQYIDKCETFGACVYIPLPETYFTKIELVLLSVEYANGEVVDINTVVAGDSRKYKDLDNITKMVYSRVNIYRSAEEKFPTKVVPQFGNTSWLCCCGNKNPNAAEVCEKCAREKEWQKNVIVSEKLEETKTRMVNDPREVTLHDKSKFKQNRYLETKEETQKKIEQYEKAMKNIALEEKYNESRKLLLIPKILLIVGFIYLLIFGIKLFIELGPLSNASSGGGGGGEQEAVETANIERDSYYLL
ncbi:MAG: hypothetical protein IKU30_03580 [Clostridia bacterium]|nr:hypothetical protein [Clostridia bacterium]